MSQFNGVQKPLIQADEHRELDDHGETSTERIHFIPLIQFHHFLVQLLSVVLILLTQSFHLRLEFLHRRHGLEALITEREEHQFDQDRQQDNSNAVVSGPLIQESQQRDQRSGNKVGPAEVDGSVKGRVNRIQGIRILRTDIQGVGERFPVPGRREAGFQGLVFITKEELGRFDVLRHHPGQEITVCEAGPTNIPWPV